MNWREEHWLYQQLEPGDIPTPARPFKSNYRPLVEISKPDKYSKLTEAEKDKRNDEWIEKHLNTNT